MTVLTDPRKIADKAAFWNTKCPTCGWVTTLRADGTEMCVNCPPRHPPTTPVRHRRKRARWPKTRHGKVALFVAVAASLAVIQHTGPQPPTYNQQEKHPVDASNLCATQSPIYLTDRQFSWVRDNCPQYAQWRANVDDINRQRAEAGMPPISY